MERLLSFSFTLLVWITQIYPSRVYAATPWGPCTNHTINGVSYTDVASIQCFVPLFRNVIVGLIQLAGIGLFLMFVVGGYQFIMSGGNPKQLEQAQHTLTYAIIGVVVIASAYLILRLIQEFTGVDVTHFTIPQ